VELETNASYTYEILPEAGGGEVIKRPIA